MQKSKENYTKHFINTMFTEIEAIHQYCFDHDGELFWDEFENCASRMTNLTQLMSSVTLLYIFAEETDVQELVQYLDGKVNIAWVMVRDVRARRDMASRK